MLSLAQTQVASSFLGHLTASGEVITQQDLGVQGDPPGEETGSEEKSGNTGDEPEVS